jgi:hypothetical protein
LTCLLLIQEKWTSEKGLFSFLVLPYCQKSAMRIPVTYCIQAVFLTPSIIVSVLLILSWWTSSSGVLLRIDKSSWCLMFVSLNDRCCFYHNDSMLFNIHESEWNPLSLSVSISRWYECIVLWNDEANSIAYRSCYRKCYVLRMWLTNVSLVYQDKLEPNHYMNSSTIVLVWQSIHW